MPVKVPDRLTTWRVLALAHSRQGGQAGAVTSFLGTLPTYVDPVVPAFLLAGDEVRLPVQVVNTTDAEVASPLALDAANATVSSTAAAGEGAGRRQHRAVRDAVHASRPAPRCCRPRSATPTRWSGASR